MNKETESVSKVKRRELLKMLTASGIAGGVAMLLPDSWVTPAIASVESEQVAPEAINAATLFLSSIESVYNRSTSNTTYCIPAVMLKFFVNGPLISDNSLLTLSSSNLGDFVDSISGYGGTVHYSTLPNASVQGQITLPYPGEILSGGLEDSLISVRQSANTSTNTLVINPFTVECTAPPTAVSMKAFEADDWSVGPVVTAVAGAVALGVATIAKISGDGEQEKE